MDGDLGVSLPQHFHRWDVKRAATYRVLVHLWHFADNEQAEVWCFRSDDELIESCNLRDERHLRECLRDLRLAGIAIRETGSHDRAGFRLYNRAPVSGGKTPAERRRRKPAASPAETRRFAGGKPPPHLVREHIEQTSNSPTSVVDGDEAFTLEPASAKAPRKTKGPSKADIDRCLAALNAARQKVGGRLGKARVPVLALRPGRREDIEKALRKYSADDLARSLEIRGNVGGQQDFEILGAKAAWRPGAIDFALDTLSERTEPPPDGPVVVRTPMAVKF